jgi:hypothetical protein
MTPASRSTRDHLSALSSPTRRPAYDDDEPDIYDEPDAPSEDARMDGLMEAIGTDSRRLSEKLGRPLLGAELETAARVILEDVRDGRPVDVAWSG